MPRTHVVRNGDCIDSIAKHYGFRTIDPILQHPDNAALWQAREHNVNVLAEGDRVVVPDFEDRNEACNTGSRHTFRVPAQRTWFHFRIALRGPHAYELKVEGEMFSGQVAGTPDDAPERHRIPADAATGELRTWPLGDTVGNTRSPNADDSNAAGEAEPPGLNVWQLQFGHLDPIAHVRGVQQRLNNLGFDAGPVDGIEGEATRDAVATFQRAHDLEVTGRVDDVRVRLRDVYGE